MLTSDEKRLTLFVNGISVDETLPKYTRVKEELDKKKGKNYDDLEEMSTPFMDTELVDIARGETFEQFRDMDTHSINVYLSEKEYKHFMKGGRHSFVTTNGSTSFISVSGSASSAVGPVPISINNVPKEKRSLIKRLFGKKIDPKENEEENVDKY